jgi:hypothetical protein
MQFDIAVIEFLDPVDDEHSGGKLFCWNPSCSCHEDEQYLYQVLLYVQDGLMTPQEATDFVKGKGI